MSHDTCSKTCPDIDTAALDTAMTQKIRVRSRFLKAVHCEDFFRKCLEAGRAPKGLRVHHSKVHLTKSPTANETCAKLNKIYRLTEQKVDNALIKHYVLVCKESGMALSQIVCTARARERHRPRSPHKKGLRPA